MEKVKFVKTMPGAITPTKATDGSAAFDLYAPKKFFVKPGRSIMPIGIAIDMGKHIKANVRSRSGFSAKGMEGTGVFFGGKGRYNCDVLLGLVDGDYRDSIGVILHNHECKSFYIEKGTRIAQLEFTMVPDIELVETDILTESKRKGGFGSTGTK